MFRKAFVTWWPAVFSATVLFSIPAFAIDSNTQMKGADFSTACTRADESWVSFCNGYVQAVIDNIRDGDGVCFPNGTTRTDVVTVVEKEITGSNRLRAMNAHEAVRSALRRFFPCR